jgi:hypothetical protein
MFYFNYPRICYVFIFFVYLINYFFMRKFYSLGVALLATVFVFNVDAQRYGMDPAIAIVNQDFTGLDVSPFTSANGISVVNNSAPTIDAERLKFSAGGSGDRASLVTLHSGTDDMTGNVYMEFEWNVGTAISSFEKYSGIIVRSSGNLAVFGFVIENWDVLAESNRLHCLNLAPLTIGTTTADGTGVITFVPGVDKLSAAGNFLDFGISLSEAIENNSSTLFAGKTFALNAVYRIKATMDFTTKKVILTVTRKDTQETVTTESLDFLQPALNVAKIEMVTFRNRLASNTTNSSWTSFFDDIKLYAGPLVEVANVTVNYVDANDVVLKTARVAYDKVVGTVYDALASDKVDISYEGSTYLYDATSTSNVTVATGDASAIVLKFTKSVSTSVKSPNTGKVVDKKYFSLTGVEVESNTVGTIIEKTIYSDGTIEIKKIVNNRR